MGSIFTVEDIIGLRSRTKANHQVAELSQGVLNALNWTHSMVYLSAESLLHINKRHPDISDFDLLLIPKIITDGLLVQENRKPNNLIGTLQVNEHIRLLVVLKRARNGFDVWVESVYRTKKRQTVSLLARGIIIRKHK